MIVDIYSENGSLSFIKTVAKVPIFEYSIICDMEVTVQKPLKRGDKLTLKITRPQFNKIKKQMENTRKSIFSRNFLF